MHSEKRQRRDWIGRGEKGGSLRGRSGNRQHERARGFSISFSPPCAVCAAQRSVDFHHHHTFARCVHGVGKWCDLCTLFGGLRWRGESGAPMLTLTILVSLFWSTAAEVTEVA